MLYRMVVVVVLVCGIDKVKYIWLEVKVVIVVIRRKGKGSTKRALEITRESVGTKKEQKLILLFWNGF